MMHQCEKLLARYRQSYCDL